MRIKHLLLLHFFSLIVFTSCRVSKPTAEARPAAVAPDSPQVLLKKLDSSEVRFDWLSGKLAVDVTSSEGNKSFNVALRMREDSVIWMLVSAFGLEAARVMITPDSVKFMSRLDGGSYFAGDYSLLEEFAKTELDFKTVQSLLLGNATSKFDPEEFTALNDRGLHLLTTLRKKRKVRQTEHMQERIERLEKKDKEQRVEKLSKTQIERLQEFMRDSTNFIAQSIWLDPAKNYKIARYRFQDFSPSRVLDLGYSHFALVDSMLIPHLLNIQMSGDKDIDIKIEYSKITVGSPLAFPYSVPEKYQRIR